VIRFAAPLALLALPVLAVLFFLGRRRSGELVLPVLAALALIVALARPELRQEERQENVYILLDRSPSVTATVAAGEVEDAVVALRAANPGKRFGIVTFASRATVPDPLSDEPIPTAFVSETGGLGARTDLAPAVNLALASMPEEDVNQIILASDGQITEGLLDAVSAACAANVPISALPLGRAVGVDASLARLDIPSRMEVGRPFQIVVSVESPTPGEATLALYRDGELSSSTSVSLENRLSRFRISDTLTSAGTHTYCVAVKRQGDPIPENDTLCAFAQTEVHPPLLVVSPEPSNALAALLAGSGITYTASRVVPALEELVDYRQILITGFPLSRLEAGDVRTLRSFVTDLGGGLLVAEGESELRGVQGGGIEDLLPVSYTLPQQAEQASLAVVYLLDRSGSMLERAGGVEKMDIVKEAAAASISLLLSDSMVGVIAFDRDFYWLRHVAPLLDGREIYESLPMLEAKGGTDIYYPIVAALDDLEQVSARVKHVLVLSDGKTVDEARDWDGLLARLQVQSDVHLSVIAVGLKANRQLLDRLAEVGRGSVYTAADFSVLPAVSLEATQRLLRSRFVTEETAVAGPLAAGDLAAIPPLQGYALTYPRPTAEVLLSAGNDPVLARWRLGLGRAGALNTDLDGIWSRDWLSWSRAPLLLEAILGSVEAETPVVQGLRPSVEVDTSGVHVRVEAWESDGTFANFLDIEAILLPNGRAILLEQTSAGLYETTLPALAEGGYGLRVADRTRDRVALVHFSVPYPEEYRRTGIDEATLRVIAQATGGRLLAGASEALPEPSTASTGLLYAPIHQHVLLLSLSLFLAELVRRKLPRRPSKLVQRT